MIAEAAYYIALRRKFQAGHEVQDWLLAESQIDAALLGAQTSGSALVMSMTHRSWCGWD